MHTHMNFTTKGFIGSTGVKTTNDRKKGHIRIANTETWKDSEGTRQERTSWFSITCFRPSIVKMIEQGWVAKSRYVEITGTIRENRWTDKDGNDHSMPQLLAEDIQFLDRKPATLDEDTSSNDNGDTPSGNNED